jgi:hypothetical protein
MQTKASLDLYLYGDPTHPDFRDVDPVDGIDDHRHAVLHKLGIKFAPHMVHNTTNIPIDITRLMKEKTAFPLYIDTWDVSLSKPELIKEESIDFLDLGHPCPPELLGHLSEDIESLQSLDSHDCRLLSLLHEFHPYHPTWPSLQNLLQDVYYKPFNVIYFDMPSYDEASWKKLYEDEYTKALPQRFYDFAHTYVHPFIYEESQDQGQSERYELVFQYWFFYPTNDGGNNHEGDWEHINVIISPLSSVTRMLAADEIQGILQGQGLDTDVFEEQLVLKRVEYYFHHYVMLLDFSRPNVYLPQDQWQKEMGSLVAEKFGEGKIWKRIRHTAYWDDAKTQINTHPLCYIGADNKGWDQILSMPGGKNRDSHGTYPFAGIYKAIGPAGASEQIATFIDHRKYFQNASYRRKIDDKRRGRGGFIRLNDPDRITIVPDWERVLDLVIDVPKACLDWSWLVLPLRWGYPATASPFAGVVSHADTGNVSPIGPAYNNSWNRVGPGQGYDLYSPHRFPWLFPLDWVDTLQNNLGFLNLPVTTITNLPPFDLAWRIFAAPFRTVFGERQPTFYTQEQIPFRFAGITGGISLQFIPDEFIILYATDPELLLEIELLILETDPGIIGVDTRTNFIIESSVGGTYQFDLFMGKRLCSYNTFHHSRNQMIYELSLTNRQEPFTLKSQLNLLEYSVSLRYNLATGAFQPYIKGGWGLSWYRLLPFHRNQC